MPKIKYIKETDNFLKIVQSSIKNSGNKWRVSFNTAKIMNHVESLSDRQLGRLFSDPYWIRYPTWRYTGGGVSTKTSRHARRYGTVIQRICQATSMKDGRVFKIMLRKSVGLWAIYTADYSSGKNKLSLLKRVYKNKDSRVRLRAAKHLPVSYLPKMSKDSHRAVRSMVIKRLGMDNCSEMFLEDKCSWIRRGAIEASPIDSIDYKSIIERFRDSSAKTTKVKNSSVPIYTGISEAVELEACIGAILKKVPKDELPYLLDLPDLAKSSWHQSRINEIIKTRMS